MKALLDSYVASGVPLQVKFTDANPPVGPAKVHAIVVTSTPRAPLGEIPVTLEHTYYRMDVPGTIGGKKVVVPLLFDADRVLYVTEGHQEVAGGSIGIGGDKRTPGGLHIG